MAWSRELHKRVNYGCYGNHNLVFWAKASTLFRPIIFYRIMPRGKYPESSIVLNNKFIEISFFTLKCTSRIVKKIPVSQTWIRKQNFNGTDTDSNYKMHSLSLLHYLIIFKKCSTAYQSRPLHKPAFWYQKCTNQVLLIYSSSHMQYFKLHLEFIAENKIFSSSLANERLCFQ